MPMPAGPAIYAAQARYRASSSKCCSPWCTGSAGGAGHGGSRQGKGLHSLSHASAWDEWQGQLSSTHSLKLQLGTALLGFLGKV